MFLYKSGARLNGHSNAAQADARHGDRHAVAKLVIATESLRNAAREEAVSQKEPNAAMAVRLLYSLPIDHTLIHCSLPRRPPKVLSSR